MKPTISFLIGSGFSRRYGIKDVAQINDRFKNLKQDQFFLYTGLNAWFLDVPDDNAQMREERIFVQEFIQFYINKFLDEQQGNFHYEKFFDFYHEFLYENKHESEINEFVTHFNTKHSKIDAYNRVWAFHRTFSQLLASILKDKGLYNEVDGVLPGYSAFVTFLEGLVNDYEVKIHSLNHDMLLEHILKSASELFNCFDNGYEIAGSEIYGRLDHREESKCERPSFHVSYKVKLPKFTNKFEKPICLYKLHGSIDTYFTRMQTKEIYFKSLYGVGKFYRELNDTKEFLSLIDTEIYPDFLSGYKTKIKQYDRHYYSNLFEVFKNNLIKSNLLIVIGYGFLDNEPRGINDYLKDYIASGKRLAIIDPNIPEIELLKNCNKIPIEKVFQNVTIEEYRRLLHS